ncbi:unnamed protein product [Durusdinium trenchii]|uniref:Uncharacterized protein n=1 Tax=Durusdinium trenchii TaxID=1381693 RepID=A0ABP0QYG6_9DINO
MGDLHGRRTWRRCVPSRSGWATHLVWHRGPRVPLRGLWGPGWVEKRRSLGVFEEKGAKEPRLGLKGTSCQAVCVFVPSLGADANADHSSWIGLLLRTILLLLPWVGADWVFHLRAEEQRRCGAVLVFASMWLWTILLILELLGACALCWGAAVFAEHELSLRHLAVRGMETAEDNSP